jgi:hypothetical protein
MKVEIKINNLPKTMREKWIVARRDDSDARLWYYGNYSTEERALAVALELGNGIVVERTGEFTTVNQYGDNCTMISNLGELNMNL